MSGSGPPRGLVWALGALIATKVKPSDGQVCKEMY